MSALEDIFEFATIPLKHGLIARTHPKYGSYTITDQRSGTSANIRTKGTTGQRARGRLPARQIRGVDISSKYIPRSGLDPRTPDPRRTAGPEASKVRLGHVASKAQLKRSGKGTSAGGTRIMHTLIKHMKDTAAKGRPVTYSASVVNPKLYKRIQKFRELNPQYANQLKVRSPAELRDQVRVGQSIRGRSAPRPPGRRIPSDYISGR